MKGNIAVKNPDDTCCSCLEEKKIIQINIPSKGYGSGFDGWSTIINLCNQCLSNTNPNWWELKDALNEFGDDWLGDVPYEYEDEIFTFIDGLSPAGKEMVRNTYSTDSYAYWEPQDYIDYELKILPHDKCKEYGAYSHEEIEAYETRYPTCQHPINVVYEDGGKHSRCMFGAFGEYNQGADCNIWNSCYGCTHYKKRETPIKEISDKDYNDYEIYYISKLNSEKYKSKFDQL